MDNIIEIKNLYYKYSDEDSEVLFEDFNLNIERGSFTAILGHNGSGKSTLAKLFNGLYKPTSGEVLVDGMLTTDEEKEIEIKRRVGLVFQNPDNQIVSSVVEEDVAFGPENLGFEPEVIREKVDNALKSVRMYDYRFSSPHNLSGGQKQRVAIAGILAMSPECIVLDEPTAMLDPVGRREVLEAITELNKKHGITIILITHFMEETENADRAIVLSSGKILADDKPSNLFSQVDMIRSAGLNVPQTVLLLNELNKNGVKVSNSVISVEKCAEVIADLFK